MSTDDPGNSLRDPRDQAIAKLEKALAEALARNEASEAVVEDQRQRLRALGTGREDSMRALAEARAELKRVSHERDELRRQLVRIDGMQTATIALPDDEPEPVRRTLEVPSLEDLMSALGQIEESGESGEPHVAGHLHQRVQAAHDPDSSEEMIAPQLVFPEKFAETAAGNDPLAPRILVLLDAERPIKYPITKETMTIGRTDMADIRIDNGFLSRLHARVISTAEGVTIEDIESKNGVRVNTKLTQRQALRHGDVVDLGRLRFRFLDTSADDGD